MSASVFAGLQPSAMKWIVLRLRDVVLEESTLRIQKVHRKDMTMSKVSSDEMCKWLCETIRIADEEALDFWEIFVSREEAVLDLKSFETESKGRECRDDGFAKWR
ncbi:uncharacterized protein BJ212DRAFT_1297162 [Suillus subaureus]|uniref:Uncharacterized protein n=1 Tax=Suillus subaureus TaxID=48587 RepID=A0A9P7EHI8_9AGAM|nr:uncharacterized protein BJ212DRAFT_1297162 [Suillus subaureus]KAG1821865.1 hypothetical protein BJ212DRAFT_1297162 [Suillus subaureus]